MRMYNKNNLNWIFILEVVIVTHEIFAQEGTTLQQDLVALCNEKGISNCEWLENPRNQNALSDLITRLNEIGDGRNLAKNKSYKMASLNDQSIGVHQYLFPRFWKGERGQLVWNEVDNSERLLSRVPFNYDNKRNNMNSFSSWGGKRDRVARDDALSNKRRPVFSSWGRKRTQKFFNWGGKRSVNGNEVLDTSSDNLEHSIMKRNAKMARGDETHGKRVCLTNEINLEELFREFIDWSRKQPEQKKDSIYKKVFRVSELRSPDNLSRRAGSFFQWGGKRNTKDN